MITLEKIKSAYEIAMEKAQKITENTSEGDYLEVREEIKPVLAKFYREDIDAEGLWQELKGKDEVYIRESQIMITDSLGLRTAEAEFKKRKEGILALESLKKNPRSSAIEQFLTKVRKLQKKHSLERERIEQQLEREMENNSQMQMKPVQTEDGRTVMKLEAGIDKETRDRFNKAISEMEARSSKQFGWLLENIKQNVKKT